MYRFAQSIPIIIHQSAKDLRYNETAFPRVSLEYIDLNLHNKEKPEINK